MDHRLTQERIIEADATRAIADVVMRHGLGKKLLLVCDDDTWSAAGMAVQAQLAAHFQVTRFSLGAHPHATVDAAQSIASITADGLIAVGSGTVNDVVKYAAQLSQRPYVVVATAASMNGYLSAGASLETGGMKQSFAAHPPRAAIADLRVIAAAPRRLVRAGLADTLCRTTVEADMMLSHFLLGAPYPRTIFDGLRAHESVLIGRVASFAAGDMDYYGWLMQALFEAGDAMAKTGSSAVASQGEHMIAHMLEMLLGQAMPDILHGELIALTTLTMSRLQQRFMMQPWALQSIPRPHGAFRPFFAKPLAFTMAQHYARKVLSDEDVMKMHQRLLHDEATIKAAMQPVMLAPSLLEQTFAMLGIATQPSDYGLSMDAYEKAVVNAYLSRDRFTFLDMAAMQP